MKLPDQYSILFTSLEPGTYNYKFTADETFFEKFDESELKQGRLIINVEVQKHSGMMLLNFNITGNVSLCCDRCLEDFDYELTSNEKLTVKFGLKENGETDEIITLPASQNEIDISQYIYEFAHLALPVKRVHPEDEKGESTCNKEMIKKLEEHKGKDKNEEPDQRWEKLKKIKFN